MKVWEFVTSSFLSGDHLFFFFLGGGEFWFKNLGDVKPVLVI